MNACLQCTKNIAGLRIQHQQLFAWRVQRLAATVFSPTAWPLVHFKSGQFSFHSGSNTEGAH